MKTINHINRFMLRLKVLGVSMIPLAVVLLLLLQYDANNRMLEQSIKQNQQIELLRQAIGDTQEVVSEQKQSWDGIIQAITPPWGAEFVDQDEAGLEQMK